MASYAANQLVRALEAKFSEFEKSGRRVGTVFLHRADARLLPERRDAYDPPNDPEVMHWVGFLWGAKVFVSDYALQGHVALFPEDSSAIVYGPGAFEVLPGVQPSSEVVLSKWERLL